MNLPIFFSFYWKTSCQIKLGSLLTFSQSCIKSTAKQDLTGSNDFLLPLQCIECPIHSLMLSVLKCRWHGPWTLLDLTCLHLNYLTLQQVQQLAKEVHVFQQLLKLNISFVPLVNICNFECVYDRCIRTDTVLQLPPPPPWCCKQQTL